MKKSLSSKTNEGFLFTVYPIHASWSKLVSFTISSSPPAPPYVHLFNESLESSFMPSNPPVTFYVLCFLATVFSGLFLTYLRVSY